MIPLRLSRKEYLAIIHHKPSKGYMVQRKRAGSVERAMADLKWSVAVKVVAGLKCEYCGARKRLAAHHVYSRALKSTRCYPPNGVCLCSGHHFFYAHKYPHKFRDWIIKKRGTSWWADLQVKVNTRHERFTAADEPGRAG